MDVSKLTPREKERVLESLLLRLSQEDRRLLMIDCPTEYVRMAPHTAATVAGLVEARLAGMAEGALPEMTTTEKEILAEGIARLEGSSRQWPWEPCR